MTNMTMKTAFAALALTALLASMPLASANLSIGKADLKDVVGPDDGCHEGEQVVDCAVRVTYEFAWTIVGPIYYAAEDYCDDLTSVCPLLVKFDAQASAADARLAILEKLADDGCREGEPVIDCAVRVTYEFVWAIVGPAIVATMELCRDLTSACPYLPAFISSDSQASSANLSLALLEKLADDGCREGEPVIDCAVRVTYEFVWAIVGPAIVATMELCRDLTSACPYVYIRQI